MLVRISWHRNSAAAAEYRLGVLADVDMVAASEELKLDEATRAAIARDNNRRGRSVPTPVCL